MQKGKNNLITELSERDRKVLDKYTKYYSNFIESNTAKSSIEEDDESKMKPR